MTLRCGPTNRSLLLVAIVMQIVHLSCFEQTGGTLPPNKPMRAYLRKAYFASSQWNNHAAFNVTVAREVFRSATVLAYDTIPQDEQFRGPLDSCSIDFYVFQDVPMPPPNYALVADSIWPFIDANSLISPETFGVISYFLNPSDSAIMVYLMPRLGQRHSDGTVTALPSTILAATVYSTTRTVWLSSRVALPSTLAHELGHVALTRSDSTWKDNYPLFFINIMSNVGWYALYRQNPSTPGPVSGTSATDQNRRNLIRYGVDDACIDARINSNFARPIQ